MSEFDKYIDSIVNKLQCCNEEKEDLKEEFKDHLNLLKEEYKVKGYSDEQAVKLSIMDFGNAHQLKDGLDKVNTFNKIVKIGFSICFGVYSILLSILLLNPFRTTASYIRDQELPKDIIINIIPFKTISNYIVNFNDFNFDIILSNLLGNIIIFIPFGFLLPLVFNIGRSLKMNFVISLAIFVCIEAIQFIFALGVCDVDDVILYVIGSTLGFILYKIYLNVSKIIKSKLNYV